MKASREDFTGAGDGRPLEDLRPLILATILTRPPARPEPRREAPPPPLDPALIAAAARRVSGFSGGVERSSFREALLSVKIR